MLSVMEGFAVAVNGTAAANFPLTICSSAKYWFVAATARVEERCVVGDRRFVLRCRDVARHGRLLERGRWALKVERGPSTFLGLCSQTMNCPAAEKPSPIRDYKQAGSGQKHFPPFSMELP